MGWMDFFVINKNKAEENNYKLQLFNTVSNGTQIANMSTINRYFNQLYDNGSSLNAFTVNQSLNDVYVSQKTNKIGRLQDYRNMSTYQQLAQAIDTICFSSDIPDQNNQLIDVKIVDQNLQAKDIQSIKNAIFDYLRLFDFENNIYQYFRTFIIEGQLCWENIVAKDDLQEGIIGINIIPNDAYQFCYDVKNRKKVGIMINNTSADTFNMFHMLGGGRLNGATRTILGAYQSLNCYEQLLEDKCIVLPFEELTYIDSGIYNDDHKIVYSPLERAKRPFNQLKLIQDAILIYRVSRSPEKYVFNVDIGKMSKTRGQMEVSKLMKQFGSKKTYDPSTGTVGKAYDPMQMTQNFWFVKSGDSQGITVNPLQANHNFGNLDDLDYFHKKLLKSLNIPLQRFYGENSPIINNGDDQGITADELNFAKFIMQLQQRFSLGLLNGAITHLKYTGLWDLYQLNKNDIKIVINPPVQYVQYRRQKLLQSKVSMLKEVLGEDGISNIFSQQLALQLFMGWDKEKIQRNKQLKFKQSIENAKLEYLKKMVEEKGSLDFVSEENQKGETFKQALRKNIKLNILENNQKNNNQQEFGSKNILDQFQPESTEQDLHEIEDYYEEDDTSTQTTQSEQQGK